jgi:hypothetical protein
MTLTERLLHSTARIVGAKEQGTGFFLGRRAGPTEATPVLVTADHVFRNNPGDSVRVTVHGPTPQGGWKKIEFDLPIRKSGKDLWAKHPSQDVAAILVPANTTLPPDTSLAQAMFMSDDLLATDAVVLKLELAPGDQLFTFGFPAGYEENGLGADRMQRREFV